MSKLAVDKNKFLAFLKAIILSDKAENKEAAFSANGNSLTTLIVSTNKTLALKGVLKVEGLEQEPFAIGNLASLKKYVDSMDSTFKVEFLKNRLNLLSKSTKISVILQSPEYAVNTVEESKFNSVRKSTEGGISISLNKEIVNQLVNKFNIVSSDSLTLKVTEGKLSIDVTNEETETKLFSDFDTEVEKGVEFQVKLSKFFISILNVLNGDVTIKLAKENPVAVSVLYSNEDFSLEYVLAVMVDKDTNNE